MKNVVLALLVTGIWAYLLGGFIAGVVWCEGCNGVIGNTLGRLFVGVITAYLSAITGGFPPPDASGAGTPLNVWPFILACWGVFLGVLLIIALLGHYLCREDQ